MSRLVRLYPRAWRARYEGEFLDLLADRKLTVRDRLDIVGGAIDARMHPQIAASPDQPYPGVPLGWRLPGLFAMAGGALWCAAYANSVTSSKAADDFAPLIALALGLMATSLPGGYLAGYSRQLGRGLALAAVCLVLFSLLPWGPSFIPMLILIGLLGGGMLALGAARAGTGRTARWWLIAAVFAIPLAVLFGFGPASGQPGLWLAVVSVLPYGLAWLVLGA
jgi:hypothetical protein